MPRYIVEDYSTNDSCTIYDWLTLCIVAFVILIIGLLGMPLVFLYFAIENIL